MRTESKVQLVPTDKLRPSPRNQTIHAELEPLGRDAWLIADVEKNGILMPLLITSEGVISDGHRRHAIAKHLGISEVPCLVLHSSEDAAFHSAQLARNLSLHAKCVLYREKISELSRRGREFVATNLRRGELMGEPDPAEFVALQQEWARVVEVLGVSRASLVRGVKLLDKLDALTVEGQPDEMDRAQRVLNIFRNRGLNPALRMFGESDASDEGEPDPNHWGEGEVDEESDTLPIRRYARKQPPELLEPRIAEALRCLRRVEKLAEQVGRLTPAMSKSLDQIRREVTREPLRVA